jgi:hypothetical protein
MHDRKDKLCGCHKRWDALCSSVPVMQGLNLLLDHFPCLCFLCQTCRASIWTLEMLKFTARLTLHALWALLAKANRWSHQRGSSRVSLCPINGGKDRESMTFAAPSNNGSLHAQHAPRDYLHPIPLQLHKNAKRAAIMSVNQRSRFPLCLRWSLREDTRAYRRALLTALIVGALRSQLNRRLTTWQSNASFSLWTWNADFFLLLFKLP